MKRILKGDAYAGAISVIMISTSPFITLGFLGNRIILVVSVAIGLMALLGLVLRLGYIFKSGKSVEQAGWLTDIMTEGSLPYAIALSSLILIHNGIHASVGLWFSLVLLLMIVPAAFIKS